MKKAFPATCMVFLGLFGLWGCATFKQTFAPASQKPEEIYQQKALALEQMGELQQALLAWRIAGALNPDDVLTQKIIATLSETMENKTRTNFEAGQSHVRNGDPARAREAFLTALRTSPDHTQALRHLKHDLNHWDRTAYQVKKGDSFARIAADIYNDPTKANAIAYYNELDPSKPLQADTRLILPNLTAVYLLPRKAVQAKDQARKFSNQEPMPVSPEKHAGLVAGDDANYQKGLELMAAKQYPAALAHLNQVSESFKGKHEAIAQVQRLMQEQATQAALQAAQTKLAQKEYETALAILEQVNAQSPGNPRAKSLWDQASYEWARELIARKKEIQAIELLKTLDPDYQDTRDLLKEAKAKLNARAETFYRKGVKHFLNEELEQAIQAWENTLALNPNHPKAAGDMENARRLLEKWQGIDQKNQKKSTQTKP